MTDLYRLSAVEIAQGIRAGTFSAVEVTQAHLARIDQLNPEINAIVQDTRQEALAAAKATDDARSAGHVLPPLAGVPMTTKVNVDQAGCATTNGLTLLRDHRAEVDAPVVANMRKAGGIIVGRTNTPAFSLRWFTKNNLHGQTLNPRNHALTPGGSSGGAGAAVAAGFCAIGHGTDIAGSVRYPAYACGIHGLRPSLGRVPIGNLSSPDRFIGAQIMAVSGPLARTMTDLRLAFEAMAAPDPRDPWYAPVPTLLPPFAKRAALTLAPDGMAVAPEVKDALRRAARHLEAAGWTIDEVPCPPIRRPAHLNGVLWMAETQFGAGEMMAKEAEPDSQLVFDLMARDAGDVGLEAVMHALQERAGLVRSWEVFFEEYPLVICPVSGESPFAQQSDVRSEADFARIFEAQLTQRGLPLMGMPALSVATAPVDEVPMGVQLVSGRFREDILLNAGATIEAAEGTPTVTKPA